MKYLVEFIATYRGQIEVEEESLEDAKETARDVLAGSGAAFESDDKAELKLTVIET